MNSPTTICSYEESCSLHRREGPDRYGIACGLASSDISPTWALDGRRET